MGHPADMNEARMAVTPKRPQEVWLMNIHRTLTIPNGSYGTVFGANT